jgi:hypothetical protein
MEAIYRRIVHIKTISDQQIMISERKLELSRNNSFSTMLVQKQRFGPKSVFPSLKALPFGYTGSTRDEDEASRLKRGAKGPRFPL